MRRAARLRREPQRPSVGRFALLALLMSACHAFLSFDETRPDAGTAPSPPPNSDAALADRPDAVGVSPCPSGTRPETREYRFEVGQPLPATTNPPSFAFDFRTDEGGNRALRLVSPTSGSERAFETSIKGAYWSTLVTARIAARVQLLQASGGDNDASAALLELASMSAAEESLADVSVYRTSNGAVEACLRPNRPEDCYDPAQAPSLPWQADTRWHTVVLAISRENPQAPQFTWSFDGATVVDLTFPTTSRGDGELRFRFGLTYFRGSGGYTVEYLMDDVRLELCVAE